jgi:hypothetical protein
MAISGNLSTMPLVDLLQWLGATGRSGTLEVARHATRRKLKLRDGRVVGCTSTDPPALLGQVLLSTGKIAREDLRSALERQEVTGEGLGEILIAARVIARRDLEETLAAKAEEAIYGLFDWEDASFRFDENAEDDPHTIAVDLDIPEVVARGHQRFQEMKRFRELFSDEGIVLERTEAEPPAEVLQGRMARRIFESINGARTLAEVLLHAQASAYLVSKFLYHLHRRGLVRIKEVRPVRREEVAIEEQSALAMCAVAGARGAVAVAPPPDPDPDLAREILVAIRLLDRGENEAALELLNACRRAHPEADALGELIARAEVAVEAEHQKRLPLDRVPVLLCEPQRVAEERLSPEASYLPSLIDGSTDVQSLLWIAPMRSVDVLRALRRLLERGLIELRDPQPA